MRLSKRYEKLSCGRLLAMYTIKKRFKKNFAWIIAICILKNKRECDHWFLNQTKQIGKSLPHGLEGLVKAASWIEELKKKIKIGDHIIIYWVDDRRRRAFSRLKRYGFQETTFLGEPCYMYEKADCLL